MTTTYICYPHNSRLAGGEGKKQAILWAGVLAKASLDGEDTYRAGGKGGGGGGKDTKWTQVFSLKVRGIKTAFQSMRRHNVLPCCYKQMCWCTESMKQHIRYLHRSGFKPSGYTREQLTRKTEMGDYGI